MLAIRDSRGKIDRWSAFFASMTMLAFIAMLWLVYAGLMDANPPFESNIGDFPTDKPIYQPGDKLVMFADFCKYTTAPSSPFTAYWQREEDGLIVGFLVRDSQTSNAEGCFQQAVELQLPDDIPDGTWRRVNIAQYQVNLLANRTAEWRSTPFLVVAQ